MMKHKVEFDEAFGLMKVQVIAGITAQEITEIHKRAGKKILENKPRFFLCNLSRARLGSLYPQETRNAIGDAVKGTGYEKVAIVGEQVVLKALIKIIQKILGEKIEAEHFETEEQALSWFKFGVKF